MNALDILNKWFEITDYNPDKKTFNLLNMDDYEIHKINKFIVKICNEYDNEGLIPLIYVKYFADKYFKNLKISVLDILQNNYDDIKALQSFYDDLNSDEIKEIENNFSNTLKALSASVCSKKYLDNNQDNSYIDSLGYVIDNITKLNVDIFKKGGVIQPFTRISKSVHHFDSLANCLLSIEHAEDGMYLCYISSEISVDGYFGYFIKNNGNIFSVNERLDEKYIGQHYNLRNNRYTEEKVYELFPYEIVDFSGEDYKGYATSSLIDDEKLSFENISTACRYCIILTMYLLSKKYVGKTLSGDEVYVNSLLKQNVKAIENGNSLVLYNNSDIVKFHHAFTFNVDEKKFMSGELCKQYHKNGNYFQNINQIMVDTYGNDFDFQEAYKDILVNDKTKMLTDSSFNHDIKLNNEFIGNKDKFELQAFYELRKKLAVHIKTKMLDDYKAFGGKKALEKWWYEVLTGNMDKIKSICKDVYNDAENGVFAYDLGDFGVTKNHKTELRLIYKKNYDEIIDNDIRLSYFSCVKLNEIENPNARNLKWLDRDDNKRCEYFFIFQPHNWKWIEETFNIEVPNFIKGWWSSNFASPYVGNSSLDVVDPVDGIDSIINTRNIQYNFSFNFFIGFSKNHMKKILKG